MNNRKSLSFALSVLSTALILVAAFALISEDIHSVIFLLLFMACVTSSAAFALSKEWHI